LPILSIEELHFPVIIWLENGCEQLG